MIYLFQNTCQNFINIYIQRTRETQMKSVQIQKKDGVTYSHVPEIGGTILVPLFYKHLAELMEAGHCTHKTFYLVTDSTQAIIAEVDDKIVGFLIFNHDKVMKTTYNALGHINIDYRRRGIFTEIKMCLLKYAKDNKVDYIHSHVSVKNEASVRASRKLGFDLYISQDLPEYYEYVHSTY